MSNSRYASIRLVNLDSSNDQSNHHPGYLRRKSIISVEAVYRVPPLIAARIKAIGVKNIGLSKLLNLLSGRSV